MFKELIMNCVKSKQLNEAKNAYICIGELGLEPLIEIMASRQFGAKTLW